MTETIDSDLNFILANLPDRIPITVDQIIESGGSMHMDLSLKGIVRKLIRQINTDSGLSWDEEHLLETCFVFELKGEPEIDLRNDTMTGEIAVVKIVHTFSDENLLPFMGKRGIETISRLREHDAGDGAILERLNEIMDLIGSCNEDMRHRSVKKKVNRIRYRLASIFATNEWRIRDMGLANKVGYWIRNYVTSGTLSDLVNLTKLKVMTHSNMPIYSVKEEQ